MPEEARQLSALRALLRCGRRDEERFGLEYDLDVYNIVAVSDFNMGGQCLRPSGLIQFLGI